MDFQAFVNTFAIPCAILAVKKSTEGHCEEIRILKANDIYKEQMGVARYHDDMIYSELVPKDDKFEDFCYRAAFGKQKMHAYVNARGLNCWIDQTTLPLLSDSNKIGYCAFFFEQTREAEPERMAKVSIDTASTVIKNCITLRGTTDFNASIQAVISDIQAKTDAFCSTIIIVNPLRQKYEILCEKFRNDMARLSDFKDLLTYEIVKTWPATIGKSNGIIIKDEDDLKNLELINPEWAKSLRDADAKSVILYPLLQGAATIGYLFITNFNTDNLIEIKEMLELSAFFLSSEIASHTLMQKLEHLSNTDILTGVKNRNAMNNRVDLFVNGENPINVPFGVVFADLNGLKQMNDSNGHEAGDVLIKNAARILREVFDGAEIYRAGGDEFVVIDINSTHEDFDAKFEKLKEKTKFGSQVCLALGSHWDDEGKNLRMAMHLADEEMYKDKESFHKEHSEFNR